MAVDLLLLAPIFKMSEVNGGGNGIPDNLAVTGASSKVYGSIEVDSENDTFPLSIPLSLSHVNHYHLNRKQFFDIVRTQY